jgi:hypothetical protein
VAVEPLAVQGGEHLGRFVRVQGLDVDAALVALRVDGDVNDLGTI